MFLHSCPARLLFICGKQTFINHYSLYVFFFWVWKHKVKKYTYNSRQTDAAHGEIAISKDSSANTNGQRYRNNDGVSGVVQVHFVLYKVLYAHRSDGTKEQQHNATKHGCRYALQQGTELSDYRKDDGSGCRNANNIEKSPNLLVISI